MSVLIIFIQKAIVQGICILYGALGEIMTEKSGNLNLGIPGIMYMGGISGLMGAFLYEKDNPDPNALVGVLISFLCAFACAAIGGLIYSILTITLRVNQNVTGLALTIFGTGFGNFFGGSISKLAGGVGQISVKVTGSAYTAKIPGLSKIPVIGGILFNYGFLTYLCIIIAVLLSFFLFKTRAGLNLRAIGENPGTADAAGINVIKYKYLYRCRSGRSGRTLFRNGIFRRNLDRQWFWRSWLACCCTGNLCIMETTECNLGSIPVRSSLYSVSLYPGTWTKHAGSI